MKKWLSNNGVTCSHAKVMLRNFGGSVDFPPWGVQNEFVLLPI